MNLSSKTVPHLFVITYPCITNTKRNRGNKRKWVQVAWGMSSWNKGSKWSFLIKNTYEFSRRAKQQQENDTNQQSTTTNWHNNAWWSKHHLPAKWEGSVHQLKPKTNEKNGQQTRLVIFILFFWERESKWGREYWQLEECTIPSVQCCFPNKKRNFCANSTKRIFLAKIQKAMQLKCCLDTT